MISTSAEYKTQVEQSNVKWTPSLTIDYSDYNIDNSIATIVTDSDRLSDDQQIADGVKSPTYKWWTWNNFEWGQHLRSEVHTENEKGALSERISFPDNTFPRIPAKISGHTVASPSTPVSTYVEPPSFSVQFLPRTVTALEVNFDDKLQEYGVDFDVIVYVNGAVDTTINVTGNSSVKWEQDLAPDIADVTRVEVVVYEWSHPGVKAKIMESFTSLQVEYDESQIISMAIFEESNPAGATTPIGNVTANTCNIRLINLNSEFDNDNSNSAIGGNVIRNRRIKPFVQLNDIDTIPWGSFFSTKWTVNNNQMWVDVTGQDIIALMAEQEYTKSQFITPGSNQVFTYTTTADFNTFTLDNLVSANNELQFGGAAVLCPGSLAPTNISGHFVASSLSISTGYLYCGEGTKAISYTYTPGTTVTVTVASNQTLITGSFIKYSISYTAVENFVELVNGVGSFVPEDVTATSQSVTLKTEIFTQNLSGTLAIQDITVTLSESITLFSLAAKVIQEFDADTNLIEGRYEIAQEYAEYPIPNAYLSPQSYRDVLRLITEAGAGRAYQRRDQYLILESVTGVGTPMKTYDNSNTQLIEKPTGQGDLYNRVTVKVNALTQAASSTEAATLSVEIADTEVQNLTAFFKVDPTDTITYSGLPGGVTVTDSTEYTWGVDIELTNASGSDQSFTLTVNGKPYTVTGGQQYQIDDSESTRKNGVIELPIDNPLIQTLDQAQQIGDLLINSFSAQKREVLIDGQPDPSIELNDTIEEGTGNFYLINSSELRLGNNRLIHRLRGKR